jgi:NADH:ubiquinone oxidoreductase subunit 5 (subunit L)/multisubunit Na+/H+ antiporter MnhA subunit
MQARKLAYLSLLTSSAANFASAAPDMSWVGSLSMVAYSLGWLMMVFMGVKWIVADSPNERADAKKGMIYVVIGLLIVRSAQSLLNLYCDTVNASGSIPGGITCITI